MADANTLPDNDDVKKKALVRLAVAGLVTAAALAGLWWLDQGKQARPEKTAQAPRPAPIQPAAPPAPALPQTEPLPATVGESPAAEPSVSSPAIPADAGAPHEAPPPPRVSNTPRQAPPTVPPPPHPMPPAPAPTPQQAPAPATVQAGGGFMVQLGVFSSPARAEELLQRLRKQGIRAHSETRVYVGPFLNREEADKAQTEMRRLGLNGLVTTAAPTK